MKSKSYVLQLPLLMRFVADTFHVCKKGLSSTKSHLPRLLIDSFFMVSFGKFYKHHYHYPSPNAGDGKGIYLNGN